MVKHHVTGLKVAVEETVNVWQRIIRIFRQVFCKETEVCFQFQFVEIQFGSLEETVLKVVQVEKHGVYIEFCLRITVGEVQFACSPDLYVWQFADSAL